MTRWGDNAAVFTLHEPRRRRRGLLPPCHCDCACATKTGLTVCPRCREAGHLPQAEVERRDRLAVADNAPSL